MFQQKVAISITARNLTRQAIQSVSTSLNNLKNQATTVNRRMGSLGQKITGVTGAAKDIGESGTKGLLKLNAGLMLLDATAGLVSGSFNVLGNAIAGAFDREIEGIQMVNTVMNTLKLNADQARIFVQDLNETISETARTLPVGANEVRSVFTNIIDDYTQAMGAAGATTGQMRAVLLQDSTRIALAQMSAGTSRQETQAALSAFLSGGVGVRGLSTYSFFANNVGIRNAIASQAAQRGITNFGDVTALERIRILSASLEEAMPQHFIDDLQNTARGTLSSFRDLFLDAETGILSLTRDLDSDTQGYQSVFTSFRTTLDLLFGSSGILAQFGRLSGISSDALGLGLKGMVDGVNGILTGFNNALTGMKILDAEGIGAAVGELTTLAPSSPTA
ncbi:MAG: hypothetical protein F6K65_22140, partial [Moorea sp. SIO3C2]|nr:hypothetical protein [Moorena sp. SIO3C2]